MAQDLQVWESGAYHHRKGLWVYESGWKPAKGGWVWESGAWHSFLSGIIITPTSTVYDSPGSNCFVSGNGAGLQYTVTGGTAPYTAVLTKLSGGSEFNVSQSNVTYPTSVGASNTAAVRESGVFRLTLTDSLGASNFVDLTLSGAAF